MSKVKRYDPPVVKWKRKRGILFYLFLLPLFLSVVFALFGLNVKAFLFNTLAFVMMYATFIVAKKGFLQQDEYEEAKLAKAPKTPYKQIAASMLAVTVFFTAYIAGNKALFESLFLSLISFVGFWLYYGFDPKKDNKKLLPGDRWVGIDNQTTISDIVKRIKGSDFPGFIPTLYKIVGPDGVFYGYLFTGWSHIVLKKIDDDTLSVYGLDDPPEYLDIRGAVLFDKNLGLAKK